MSNPESPTRCHAIGALHVGGVEVAAFRCDRDEGHTRSVGPLDNVTSMIEAKRRLEYGQPFDGTPHRYVLEWAEDDVELMPSHELFDPDESFDVDVPLADTCSPSVPRCIGSERGGPCSCGEEPHAL